jgi:hypothetical protein
VEKGVQSGGKNYLADILEPLVALLSTTMFQGKPWTFQQDSAPAHMAKVFQKWLKTNTPDFISKPE